MGATGFVYNVILLFVNWAVAVWAVLRLTGDAQSAGTTAIVVGVILSLIAVLAVLKDARWAWPFTAIVYSLALLNNLLLISWMGTSARVLVAMIFVALGLLTAIISIDIAPIEVSSPAPAVETYEAQHEKKAAKKRRK